MLCDNLEGWVGVGGGREAQEGGDVLYLWLIHVNIWQKPTQYCKAIILQLKILQSSYKIIFWRIVIEKYVSNKSLSENPISKLNVHYDYLLQFF